MDIGELKIGKRVCCKERSFGVISKEPYCAGSIGMCADFIDDKGNTHAMIPIWCFTEKLVLPESFKDLVEFK